METGTERVVQGDEGARTFSPVQEELSVEGHTSDCQAGCPPHVHAPIGDGASSESPEGVREGTPEITEAQYRKLRGQYFTVRHIPLTDCGHKMDVINQPRHANCENCWWQWFNFHPKLVETVDEAWREHGKAFVVKLRGKKFADMFARFIVTVVAFKKQEEALRENTTDTDKLRGTGVEAGEVRTGDSDRAAYPVIESGEGQGGERSSEGDEQGTRESAPADGQESGPASSVVPN